MDVYLLGLIAITLLVIILLIIYLTSRVHDLEKETLSMAARLKEAAVQSSAVQGPFAGMSGQTLWDALCGSPPPNVDEAKLEEVRKNYESVLTKHIQSLFWEGSTPNAGRSHYYKNRVSIEKRLNAGALDEYVGLGASYAVYLAQPKT